MIGQVIWARYTRRIPTWLAWLFCSLAWSLYVLADIVDVGRPNTSYNLALAIAVLFFLMGLFAEPKLRPRRLWIALSERAYSLYLMHALVAFVTLDLVSPLVPFEIGLVLAIGTTAAAVELNYRLVERPSHQLGRRLARRRPTRATPPSTVDKPAPVDGQPPAPAEADTTTLPKVGHVPLGIAPERLPAPVPAARPRGPRPLPPETPQGRRPARPPADQSWTPPTRGRMEPGAGDGRLGGQRPRQLHP